MSDHRWTVDEFGEMTYGPDRVTIAELHDPDTSYNVAVAGLRALQQAVRDADTLTKARRIAKKAGKGGTFVADDATVWRLLNLLTEDTK